jgi:hypothetical protein
MPVEIREVIIKTEISSIDKNRSGAARERELTIFKRQVLEECKRLLAVSTKKTSNKR